MIITRREFLAGAAASILLLPEISLAQDKKDKKQLPAIISTWRFGKRANEEAAKVLQKGGSAIEAVEKGINLIELDPEETSVGYGGLPNEEGEVELDAMIMDGKTHTAGSVAALKYIKTPISVARKVMEKTKHTMLVGNHAFEFAQKYGFKKEQLLTEKAKKIWQRWKNNPKRETFWKPDTIGMVIVDKDGNIAVGCSTSGLAFKIKGRVGDSPIIGSGAYCDNDAGGAAATGNGDIMMRFCPAYQAVEFMRKGWHPAKACQKAIQRIVKKGYKAGLKKGFKGVFCLIALDKEGNFGAYGAGIKRFPYAVWKKNFSEVREA
jgi:N4-(beta-N-acetylglucosaminyl)-L-asparaginase